VLHARTARASGRSSIGRHMTAATTLAAIAVIQIPK
jgi:hypothetical protein